MPPPGLHTTECELIQERLERLETLFVCSPSLAATVDEVLNQMLSTTTESTEKDAKLQKLYEKDKIVLTSIPRIPVEAHGTTLSTPANKSAHTLTSVIRTQRQLLNMAQPASMLRARHLQLRMVRSDQTIRCQFIARLWN